MLCTFKYYAVKSVKITIIYSIPLLDAVRIILIDYLYPVFLVVHVIMLYKSPIRIKLKQM